MGTHAFIRRLSGLLLLTQAAVHLRGMRLVYKHEARSP